MIKVCLVCPTIQLKRPILDIIKQLEHNKIALLYPKKIFKRFDKDSNFRNVDNGKVYTYSVINPPFLSSEFSIPVNPMFLIYLFKILLRHDVIHMWVPFYISNTLLAVLKKLFLPRKKLILTMDTIPAYSFKMGKVMDLFFKIYYRTIGKIVFSASDIIILYGESFKKYAIMAGIPKNKIIITPTGINLKIKKQDRDIRKEFNISKDEKIILYVGLLNSRKGIDLIIKIAQKFLKKKTKFIFVGGGIKTKYYQKVVKRRRLDDIIIFTGFRKDVYNFYQEADVFFIPSRGEGLAGVLMESMLYGVPIVASNIPGTRDLIKDNYNGFLCEVEDIDSYKNKIELLLNNEKLKEKFIKNSKKIIVRNFTWENNIKRFKSLYVKENFYV